jgi:hypothetical protein
MYFIVIAGVIPEFIAKWISGHGIPPSFLCLSALEGDLETAESEGSTTTSCSEASNEATRPVKLVHMKSRSVSLSGNPIIS